MRLRTLKSPSELLRARVIGLPKHEAIFVENAFCRLKYLFLAWTLLGPLNFVAMNTWARPHLAPAFAVPLTPALVLAHALMIVPPTLLVFGHRRQLSLRAARYRLMLTGLSVLAGTGLVQGWSHFEPAVAGFSFAYAAVLTLFPIPPLALALCFICGLLTALIAALSSGFPEPSSETWFEIAWLNPSIALGGCGIAINYRARVAQRRQWIDELLLRRKSSEIARQRAQIERKNCDLQHMLGRALTEPVAHAVHSGGAFRPTIAEMTIIACDVVGFTRHCEHLPAEVVVDQLRRLSRALDECCKEFRVEPLRSQGDSWLALAGLVHLIGNEEGVAPIDAVLAMLKLRDRLPPRGQDDPVRGEHSELLWPIRIGAHCGPVYMAVMDGARLFFDVWGEAVNIAARIEQGGVPNAIFVSERLLGATRGLFDHGAIEAVEVKGTTVRVAEVIGIKNEYVDQHGQPNQTFWNIYSAPVFPVVFPRREGSLAR